MANDTKIEFLRELTHRYPTLRKLGNSHSLYEVNNGAARIYIRYSAVHDKGQTFYGLRAEDLRILEGHPSVICFLWNGQEEPLFMPFVEYEDVFQSLSPAGDGQHKIQIYLRDDDTELYIPRAGRFNAEGYFGWDRLKDLAGSIQGDVPRDLSHSQIQTILGAIGAAKNFDIWIPASDRSRLDFGLTQQFDFRETPPYGFEEVKDILQEVDVIWLRRGSNEIQALFEIEHSTPIYSGLLRFNDIHLAVPKIRPRFSIVANDARQALFVRQLNRPTFRSSGLIELCTFLEYVNVWHWYSRITVGQ